VPSLVPGPQDRGHGAAAAAYSADYSLGMTGNPFGGFTATAEWISRFRAG
jgi:hypothetical protein